MLIILLLLFIDSLDIQLRVLGVTQYLNLEIKAFLIYSKLASRLIC